MNRVFILSGAFLVLAAILSLNVEHDDLKSLKLQHKKARLSRNTCGMQDLSCHRHYLNLIKRLEGRIDLLEKKVINTKEG
ncbi:MULTISPECIES: hypothetical protein [Halobacteriovorax]|uniref:Uncharacterized protein n=1 Tax=Halobacteriovorax vibrionivorans TaxID=2152716 RepID=A0ABY0ICI4_9BACT|nr:MULTISPECIES: hypothetical protein [Halobacteriovorax]AYF44574.1 hypothetical protein BALOs_1573 [Halobacteriovorax sp. BALOs_7]RZF20663.1 hypothetical protein DAY19_11805 [Halobacteriovorax vibrionivorans]TGD48927.1 hypothetical protein EP118_01925 [Halobacteriovorax sp. Y22]